MKIKLLIWLFICPFLSKAQPIIDVAQFFSQAIGEGDSLSASESRRVRFPWIEQYELRTQTRDLDASQQQYTLRISPSTIRKRNAQKALSSHLRLAPDFDQQESFCDGLFEVYADWIALYLIHEEQKLLKQLDTLLQDRQRVFEKMAGSYDFDFKELIQLQTAKSDLDIALHALSLELARLREKYGFPEGEFDFRDFITTAEMRSRIGILAGDSLARSDAELVYEQELIKRELELERAESRQVFDFAQFRYEGPRTDFFRERFSVGIGLTLPNSGNRRLKIQELQLEQKALEREQMRDAARQQQSLQEKQQKLLRDMAAFSFSQESLARERQQLEKLAAEIARKEGFNPTLLLDIEQRHIDMRLKACKEQEDLLFDYLQFLETGGLLCERTDMNFLAR